MRIKFIQNIIDILRGKRNNRHSKAYFLRIRKSILNKIQKIKKKASKNGKKIKVAFLFMYATDCQNLSLFEKMLEQDAPKEISPQQEEKQEPAEESSLADKMTYPKALSYILDEGPLQGVHTLLMVDKPGNILFEGDYDVNDTDKFRHKIILRSENKFLAPMRFSQEIDVETLSDEEEHLRAYYYPEGDDPVLFTPYQMPDEDIV